MDTYLERKEEEKLLVNMLKGFLIYNKLNFSSKPDYKQHSKSPSDHKKPTTISSRRTQWK